jgi:uncharacterized membrane protein YraQ (UPF0718 family)
MATTSDVRPLDPPDGPAERPLAPLVRRLLGLVLIAAVVFGFTALIGFPRLDVVREEVAIATAVDVARAGVPADQVSNCFQGFCFEDDVGFLQKWWDFSSTYLRLVWPGLLLAFLVAAIVDVFVFRSGRGPAYGTWNTIGLVARAERRGTALVPSGGLDEGGAGIAVGAVAAPIVAMAIVLFTPSVWGPAVAIGLLVAGAMLLMAREGSSTPDDDAPGLSQLDRETLTSATRFALRLAPAFVVVAFLGGLGTQYLTVEGVEAVAGDRGIAVALALVVGLLLHLPLGYCLPIAALALLVGADPVVAGVLLAATSIASFTSVGTLLRLSGTRVVVTLLVVLVAGTFGSVAAARAVISVTSGPTITWDGEACSYRGPSRFGPGVYDFDVVNETEDEDDGHTLAIVVGQLPDNVSLDHFEATVASDRTADLPNWFTVAGTREFVFPGDTETAQITFHDPGRYAVVCLDGGGFYVILEFSMPQPMGWFDEFRSTFNGYVAEETFMVAG